MIYLYLVTNPFDFNLSGSNYNMDNLKTANFNQTTNRFSNILTSRYFKNVNNRKYQSNSYMGINYGIDIGSGKRDTTNKWNQKNYSFQSFVSTYNRLYNANEYFLLLGFYGNIELDRVNAENYEYNNGNWQTNQEFQNNSNRYSFNGDLGIGKGRIEPIEDARQALYILEE